MTLTPNQKERYSRMLALHDISESDMESIASSTVSVVGAGGLGSPALRLMTAIGFGKIRIIDRDVVELSNIQRQTIYNTVDVGMPKAEAAAANLALLNPHVEFEPISASIAEDNAATLLKGSDSIIDGLDSFETRFTVNRVSVSMKIPYLFAGAIEYHSNLSTFIPDKTGCLHCLSGNAQDNSDYTCANVGVTPELLSIAASVQVREAVLLATGREPRLANRLMFIDMTSLSFDFFDIGRDEDCPVCSVNAPLPSVTESDAPRVTTLCSGTFNLTPGSAVEIDMNSIAERLSRSYEVRQAKRWLKIRSQQGTEVTLMPQGNAIIKGVKSEQEALELYQAILMDSQG
ncbi:MAG: HesA/MoeB/ThiF family protein [Candidatus Thorarchaeota archaeon]|jgi:adenylyltransferase/sulfurtransferase